ncbi:MAG: VOC family protein [Gemmatimonadetes bacterium]|nr:VOC family protein [Gemmatimonadota bacterium]
MNNSFLQIYVLMVAAWIAVGFLLGLWRSRSDRLRGGVVGAVVGALLGGILASLMTFGGGNRETEPVATTGIPAPYLALDHATVAVKNLEATGRVFEAMGFTIKPGRLHDNSINNLHIKFADGSSVELLTATEAHDPLSNEYLGLIRQGDGGAFLALRTNRFDAVTALWEGMDLSMSYGMSDGMRSATIERGHPLRLVWLVDKNDPGQDERQHTTHANTASRLAAVWFGGDISGELRALLQRMGFDGDERVALSDGEIIFTDLKGGVAARPLVGVTIEVANLEAAAKQLADNHVSVQRREADDKTTFLIRPEHAGGIWVELAPSN